MKVVFELPNCDSALQTFAPVVRQLREHHPPIECLALSLCEYFGRETDDTLLDPVFDSVLQPEVSLTGSRSHSQSRGWLPGRVGTIMASRRALARLLASPGIAAVVMTNDRRFPEIDLVRISSRMGIPTLLLQESIRKDLAFPKRGSLASVFLRWTLRYERGRLRHGEGGCDAIGAWGRQGRDYFEAVGAPPDGVFILGSPRLQSLWAACRDLSTEQARNELGLPLRARIFLLATNPLDRMGIASQAEYLWTIEQILAAAKRVGAEDQSLLLAVKPHRLEVRDWPGLGRFDPSEDAPHVRWLPEIPLGPAIRAADAVLIFNSTVAVEAVMLRRPVVEINFKGWDLGTDFAAHGVVQPVQTVQALEAVFRRSPAPPPESALTYYVESIDRADKLVAEKILSMARGKG